MRPGHVRPSNVTVASRGTRFRPFNQVTAVGLRTSTAITEAPSNVARLGFIDNSRVWRTGTTSSGRRNVGREGEAPGAAREKTKDKLKLVLLLQVGITVQPLFIKSEQRAGLFVADPA